MTIPVPWTEKYRPATLEDALLGPTLRTKLEGYPWKKPLLLHGPPGCGKTLLAELLARKLDFELIPITDDNLSQVAIISQTGSLFGRRRLLLFDQVETIRNIRAVTEFLKKHHVPTLLLTSDLKSSRLKTIKRYCEKIPVRKIHSSTLAKFMEEICQKEGIEIPPDLLERLVDNSQGDIRAALLDLEMVVRGKKKITEGDLGILAARDRVQDIYSVLSQILIKDDPLSSRDSLYDLSEKPETVLLWLDENLPKVYSRDDLQRGLHYLSRADIFLGRIYRRQYWGFLRYANTLMSSGVTASKSRCVNYVRYQYPYYIIHLSQTKKARNLKKSLAEKVGLFLHVSSRVFNREYLPLFRTLLKNKKVTPEELGGKFSLTPEELEFLSV